MANPFIALTIDAMRKQITTHEFSWVRALGGHYDIFHIHWPEGLVRGGRSKWIGSIKSILCLFLVLRLELQGKPIVQTLHNETPHADERRLERWLRKRLDKQTDCWLVLNRHSRPRSAARAVLIPHGHYIDWFEKYPHRLAPLPNHVVYFGFIKPYKNVVALIECFSRPELQASNLTVAGYVVGSSYETQVVDAARPLSRVNLDLRHLSEEELVRLVTSAQLIVLPYENMHNSGAILLALSLRRPVLVPHNKITDDLAYEVGAEWVRRYEGQLTSEGLEHALGESKQLVTSDKVPDLSNRDWATISTMLAETFQEVHHPQNGRER